VEVFSLKKDSSSRMFVFIRDLQRPTAADTFERLTLAVATLPLLMLCYRRRPPINNDQNTDDDNNSRKTLPHINFFFKSPCNGHRK